MDGFKPQRRVGASPFDQIRHVDEDPERGEFEYWSAREAMPYLGYGTWEGICAVIERAKIACRNTGNDVGLNFRDVSINQTDKRMTAQDVQMTRFGMYLLAMNGIPTKREIAAAQRYFAVQTYRAEQQLPVEVKVRIDPPQTPSAPAISPWAFRFRRTFAPHYRELNDLFPGHFTVISATLIEMMVLEDEINRHLMMTFSTDRPDVSIGRCWSDYRKERGKPQATKAVPLNLPDQAIDVEVAVYGPEETGDFKIWFHSIYLPKLLPRYLDNKKTLKPYGVLPRASAADNTCRELTGRGAVLKEHVRKELRAAGGFVPARSLPGVNKPPSLN